MGTYCCRNGQLWLSKWESSIYIWRSKWAPNAVEMDTAALVRTEKKLEEGPPSSLTISTAVEMSPPTLLLSKRPATFETVRLRTVLRTVLNRTVLNDTVLNVLQPGSLIKRKIRETVRVYPYLIRIGNSWQLVIDGTPFLQTVLASNALLLLMAANYVFNVEYCSNVSPTFLSWQSEILGVHDSTNCRQVKLLLPQLKRECNALF